MFETEPENKAKLRPSWIMIGLAIISLLIIATVLGINHYQRKSESSSPVTLSEQEFPAVHAFVALGIFTIPSCARYDQEIDPQKPIISIPTVQEAKLAGYRPVANCEAIELRFQKEKERLGEMRASTNTENWKIQRVAFSKDPEC